MSWFWTETLPFAFDPLVLPRLPNTQRASVGPSDTLVKARLPAEVGSRVSGWPGTLRVSVAEQYFRTPTEPLYQATLFTPDNGTRIAELDVPFVVPVELPIEVHVTPIRWNLLAGAAITEHVIVTAWTSQGEPFAYGGTLWLQVPPETGVDIPDWTGAITVLETTGIVFTWRDAFGAAVGTFTGTYQPRPRRATQVSHGDPELTIPILCHWTQ